MSETKKQLVGKLVRLKNQVKDFPKIRGRQPLENKIRKAIDFCGDYKCSEDSQKLIRLLVDENQADVKKFKTLVDRHERQKAAEIEARSVFNK